MTLEPARWRRSLIDFFSDANDAPYDFRTVGEEKCFGAGADGPPRQLVIEHGGGIAAAAVICGKYLRLLAVQRSLRRGGVGSELLRDAEALVRAAGHRTIVVGGEPGNYFVPGTLSEDEKLCRFFEQRGYVRTGEAVNLIADLSHRHWERGAAAGIERAQPSEREAVESFIEAHFGALWRFEVGHAFLDDTPPLFLARRDGELVGFSAHDVNNRGLGFYGPAGVRREVRGGGIGAALLTRSLSDLADRGYARTIIPWVSSIDFYRKVAHAEISNRFVTMEKELGPT